MKKNQNKTISKKPRTTLKRVASTSQNRSSAVLHHKYADGLVHIYKQEAQDIDRFAAFAQTLKSQ